MTTATTNALPSVNPATGETIATYQEMTPGDVDGILELSHQAFQQWRTTPFAKRAGLMKSAGEVLRRRREELARLMAQEMGKPVRDGRAETDKCAAVCDYYADNAERFLAPEPIETEATRSYVTFQPIGCVLAVMPWNFPFWQVFRFIAPGLMAGNAGLLKHASNVCGCALAIEDILREAGFPEHLFRTLLVSSRQVAGIIEDHRVAAVTLTGSTPAGQAVARTAGGCIKKSVLELGGSDPYVILEDADLADAAEACVKSRLINAGQSCIAAKRFIVPPGIKDEFERRFVEIMKSKIMGDPMSEETAVGPQAREDLRDDLHRQVAESVKKGARCLLGGEVPDGPGAYYPPTVLTDVKPGMPAYDEELFGPVASIIPAADDDDAVRIANDSIFGLGAAVFTGDAKRGETIAATRLEAGCCFVNTHVRSDPRLPFGGVKTSGYGRELGVYGIKEFVNIKTVYVK